MRMSLLLMLALLTGCAAPSQLVRDMDTTDCGSWEIVVAEHKTVVVCHDSHR